MLEVGSDVRGTGLRHIIRRVGLDVKRHWPGAYQRWGLDVRGTGLGHIITRICGGIRHVSEAVLALAMITDE